MRQSKRILVLLSACFLLIAYFGYERSRAQQAATQTAPTVKFEDADSPDTKGTFTSKFANAPESVSYGSATIPHGIYVQTSRPPCYGAPGWSSNNYSSCANVVVYLPLTAHVDGVVGYARETGQTAWLVCNSPQQDCPVGWATFDPGYQISTSPSNVTVSWTFKNWSHNRSRDAQIAVSWH
jgi:hypothetical protein